MHARGFTAFTSNVALLLWLTTVTPPSAAGECPTAAGPLPVRSLDLTTTVLPDPLPDCGKVTNDVAGGGTTLKHLKCGGLNIGGGASTVLQGAIPNGATTRFCIPDCDASTCTLSAGTDFSATHDCSATGCFFGPPLEIPNGGTTTCVVNTFLGNGSGTINYNTGETTDMVIPLNSQTYLTGNSGQPCPRCRTGGAGGSFCAGTPSSPCTGTCDRGANQGGTCISTNSLGISKDCPPGGTAPANGLCTGPGTPNACCTGAGTGSGMGSFCAPRPCEAGNSTNSAWTCRDSSLNLGGIPVSLDPLSTGKTSKADATGAFCPGQDAASYHGCFGTSTGIADSSATGLCKYFEENGMASGSLLPIGTPRDTIVAAVFCIPETSSSIINFAAALPGPGSISLVVGLALNPGDVVPTTTTTVTTTSITSPAGTTTTRSQPGATLTTVTVALTTSTTAPSRCGDASTFAAMRCRLTAAIEETQARTFKPKLRRMLLTRMGSSRLRLERGLALRTKGEGKRARIAVGQAGSQIKAALKLLRSPSADVNVPDDLRQFLLRELDSVRSGLLDLRATLTPG